MPFFKKKPLAEPLKPLSPEDFQEEDMPMEEYQPKPLVQSPQYPQQKSTIQRVAQKVEEVTEGLSGAVYRTQPAVPQQMEEEPQPIVVQSPKILRQPQPAVVQSNNAIIDFITKLDARLASVEARMSDIESWLFRLTK